MVLTSLAYLDKCHLVYCSSGIKATAAQHHIAALTIDVFLAWEPQAPRSMRALAGRAFERLMFTYLG